MERLDQLMAIKRAKVFAELDREHMKSASTQASKTFLEVRADTLQMLANVAEEYFQSIGVYDD